MTPTKRELADSQFVSWSAPEVAWTIEYPLEVMNEIRAYACDELMRLSHGGDEVGGVMYGSRHDELHSHSHLASDCLRTHRRRRRCGSPTAIV